MREVKRSTSFFEKKGCAAREAKKPFESGAWAVAAPTLKAQIKRSFLVLFFKKELLPALAF
jgi:hypothetical protein